MVTDRTLFMGYGFIVTEEEAEKFNESLAIQEDGTYEALFIEVQENYYGVTVEPAGNRWQGEDGYLIALEVESADVLGGDKGPGMLGTYAIPHRIPERAGVLYDIRSLVLPGVIDRTIGWHVGVYVS